MEEKKMFLNFFMPNSADQNAGYKIFGPVHILWIIVPILFLIGLAFLARKNKTWGKWILLVLAISLLVMRFVKYIILKPFFWDEGWISVIPFELCTIMTYIFPFTIFFKTDKLNRYIYPLAVLGGTVTIAYSEWIFNGRGMDVDKLESLLAHWIIIYIPFVRIAMGQFKLKFKEIYKPVIALIILVAYAWLANTYFTPGSNHMFLRSNPLPFQIPGIHHIFTLGLVFIALIILLYFPFNLRKVKISL
jgi:hypothetical protein